MSPYLLLSSTCGNKTLYFKNEGLWERNIPLKDICTSVSSGHLFWMIGFAELKH